MSSETQVVLDVAQVVVSREKASSAWSGRWKMCVALLAVAVCAAAAVFLTFNKQSHNKADETDDIRHTLRQVSSGAKTAIHLLGHIDLDAESMEWKEDVGQAFSHGGLKLKDNEIHVPRNGLYFVYSQASYRVSCTRDTEQHLSHALSRYSASYDGYKPLLSAVRTACGKTALASEEDDYAWYSAIYVGAVFDLKAGDRLRTEMVKDMLEYVETNDGKTFFGVFSL